MRIIDYVMFLRYLRYRYKRVIRDMLRVIEKVFSGIVIKEFLRYRYNRYKLEVFIYLLIPI